MKNVTFTIIVVVLSVLTLFVADAYLLSGYSVKVPDLAVITFIQTVLCGILCFLVIECYCVENGIDWLKDD